MEPSEEQLEARLFQLENSGMADRRAELEGERFLSLIHDPDSSRSFVLRHGVDNTGGAEVPDTEFFEYETRGEAERVYEGLVEQARANGQLVDEDSDTDLGDFETDGAEMNDLNSDTDDPLVVDEP